MRRHILNKWEREWLSQMADCITIKDRTRRMLQEWLEGHTYADIARAYHISGSRVGQIVEKAFRVVEAKSKSWWYQEWRPNH